MKVKISKSVLMDGIRKVQGSVEGKGSLPILQNAAIEVEGNRMAMTTTNLDITTRVVMDCETEETGNTTLPMKLLATAVSKLAEGDVTITVGKDDKAVIKGGSAVYRLAGMKFEEFPKLPKEAEDRVVRIEQSLLKDMLGKVMYARSTDDTRRTLKGVLLKVTKSEIVCVATDGRRLAAVRHDQPSDFEMEAIIPTMAVTEIVKNLTEGDLEIRFGKAQMVMEIGRFCLYAKMIEDAYPNWKQVIPSFQMKKVVIDREMLMTLIDRVRVFSDKETNSVKMTLTTGQLTVQSAATDIGEAHDAMPVKYEGEEMTVMLNPQYVLDPLNAIDDDEIDFLFSDGHSPVEIKCSTPFVYVLMPLRIQG